MTTTAPTRGPTVRSSKVTKVLDALAAGEMTLDEACKALPGALKAPTRARPATGSALLAAAEADPEPMESGTFDDVSVYRALGKITAEQYAALLAATQSGG